LNKTKRKIKKK